jgi:large subunit ribosomal protein L29
MKVGEIRDMTVDELHVREQELDDQLFRLRIQKSMGQLEAPAKIRDLRRSLARIKTILREKQPEGSKPRAAGSAQPAARSKQPTAVRKQVAAGRKQAAAGSRQ